MGTDRLSGKLALVTGGSRGIGRYTAQALHEAGATVAITGRQVKTLGEAAAQVGKRCTPVVCDHREPEAIQAMARQVLDTLGTPDILVNNAGVMLYSPVIAMPQAMWDETMETNVRGTFLTTQAFLPDMIQKGRGDIYIISSMSGKKGDPGAAAYAASKFALQGFAQSLLYEVRNSNIRVTVLNPSAVNTGEDSEPREGPGLFLHAADIAATITHLAMLPGRTLIRDLDIWGTNP